ncbi:endoglucanase-like isoform X3 [Magnolia sinica]|uniref:endoglucanase-like isoform X3 n=1 Tax=Magnolia sinica TaxID=86752 RepID=UPI00265B2D9E|nr:endoglucanase-like isoform X3 [Magnolia sinica]
MGTGAVVIVVAVVWGAAASGVLLAVEDEKAAFNYGDALEKAILFFEGQRSGKLPHNQRVKWRGDSGLSDGMLDQVKLVGGYYDAGDNIKFGWPVSFSITLLSWAVVEFKEQISSANQLSYLLSTIRWGTDFLMRAHTSPTTLYTQLFEFADNYRGSYQASCPFYCSYSGYHDELLWAAAWLFKASKDSKYMRFVMENQGWSQPVSEFSWDNKFAGAQTLLAKEYVAGNTKLGNYKSDADSFVCALMPGSSTVQIQTTKGGLLYTRDNNNMQYATSASLILLVYSKTIHGGGFGTIQCGSLYFSAIQIRAFAKSQVDYILGKNPLGMSYMVGFGVKYPMQLHHRGASIPSIRAHPTKVGCSEGYSTWYAANMPNPNTHVGAIVGGPNSNDQFNDIRSDYSHLEPTTYSNAAFIGSLAAMLGGNGCLQVIGTHANHTNLLVM